MIELIVPSAVGLGMGGFLGNDLAKRGITADNALDKHQNMARIIFAVIVATEKEVAKLTKTNRLGTNTLAEISAMKKLGLNPEYHSNFSLEQLLKRNQIALLHVRKGGISRQFAHSVALLKIDQKNQELILGNPLSGIQTKEFKRIKDYWFGEVIFVN
ncbi:MAG: hypothetical protein AB4062_07660 [Crocosphaera sp.]